MVKESVGLFRPTLSLTLSTSFQYILKREEKKEKKGDMYGVKGRGKPKRK